MFNAGHIANAVNIYAFSNEASNEMRLPKAEGEQSMAAVDGSNPKHLLLLRVNPREGD